MALVHCDPFAHYGSTQYTDIYTNGSFGASVAIGAYGPNGAPGLRFSGNLSYSVQRLGLTTSGAVCIMQGDLRISAAPVSTNVICGPILGGDVDLQCSVDINSDRTLSVHRGFGGSKTQLGSNSTYVIPLNTHIHIAVKFTIADGASGSIRVHVWEDGDTSAQVVLNVTGVDTQDLGSATWDGFDIGAGNASNTDWANVVVMDGSGASANDFLGPVDVLALWASARDTPALTDWSLSAGSDQPALIDDGTPDDDTTYLSETTQDGQMTVAVDPVPHPSRTILGAQLYASVKLASGSPSLTGIGYESATPHLGVTFAPTAAYTYLMGPYSAMPSGSAFSVALFDDLQWGLKLTTTSTGALVTQIVVAVIQPRPLDSDEPPDYEIVIGDEEGLNPLLETFRIQETLDGNTTLVCDIDSHGSPYTRFTLNDSVTVTENGVRIFGGVVTGLRERAFGGVNGGSIVVEVQATSYAINAKRRYLTQSTLAGSPSMTLGEWLTELVNEYLGEVGVTLHPDQVDGPALEALLFERTLISEAIDTVTESIGYLWSIDFHNRLRAWAPGDIAAPEDIDEDTTTALTGDVEKEEQLADGYANHVTIVGEGILVPDHLDEFVGDGSEDTFTLTYKIVGPYPYTADGQGAVAFGVVRYPATGTTESIGGLNAPGGFIWEYDPVNLTIRRRSGAPGNGVAFELPYHGLFEPNAVALDAGEIATYGLWEYVESITSVPDDLSAQELADAILAKRLASKDEFVTYQTRDLGYHPGQFQNLQIPSRVVAGDFLITQVETFAEQGSPLLVRRVKAAKSLNNDADWRKVYQQWYGVGGSSSSSTTSAAADSGAGAGLGLHAQHHTLGGIDSINVEDLAASDGSDGDVLTRSGAGSVWAPPTGGGSPGDLAISQTIRVIASGAAGTINVNSTSYISLAPFEFSVDTTFFPFTHYRILISGASNASGETITAQLATGFGTPTTPVHTGGNDLVVTFSAALFDSGYLTKDVSDSGLRNYIIALKGSNSTVDITLTHVSVVLKIDP